ncbi:MULTISPECIES: ABC transporter ATP-binding protein [Erysipelotrichaceae]|jgi:ABC-2 type transport system ATP-binding protein|uniref:ABC transporter ATP-binding protein n=2 Tax=Amedibacillus TaxID=2749846 RepID=A0A7G9GN37_9FIRM|nr:MULTISPECIES: ABC transporter ATP-binding protein [Erysipelotrichaceae]QNM12219.1 ABC transporter ATP-binding protein [[Eubacterium] hominis]MCH4284433.1 ABC transporter ATP-binding protein [Amedibacillus hominis]RGB57325.1 ABC transporter ATP-binding protein [Absiella sp. AM22-9]RGB59602.1 ABC transporter ATP-binding protein [Absiella sp. AM10-20]RGB66423.1 ABC transporter ATP-binding protein [Absiella sp. AM09-45]
MKLILDHVQKSYGDKEVLKDCSFTFERGKIYGLLGRNGSGKTTLFNCIAQEIDCTGSIQIEKKETMRNIIESDIGYAYSLPILPEFMTGYEFIQFYMDINEQRLEKTINIDDYFDLMRIDEDDRHRLIKGYSHGMKNKLQMLSFIISHPDIILLDEPLTSFDVVVASEMKHLLLQMKEDHILLFSTHVLQLATDLCDEIILLNNGSLTLLDHDLLNSPDFEERVVEMLRDEEHVA